LEAIDRGSAALIKAHYSLLGVCQKAPKGLSETRFFGAAQTLSRWFDKGISSQTS
jgi:hypothetical protein